MALPQMLDLSGMNLVVTTSDDIVSSGEVGTLAPPSNSSNVTSLYDDGSQAARIIYVILLFIGLLLNIVLLASVVKSNRYVTHSDTHKSVEN